MNITATLFGQMITFVLLIWFINRYLWGPLTRMMEDRKKRIAEGLAASERGKHEQVLAEQRAKEILQEAKNKAADIVALAQKRGNEVVEEAKDQARVEADRIIAAAHAEIQQEVNRARDQLRGQVVSLAVAGAGKVLKKEIDPKAHDGMLQDLVAQL